MKVLNRQDFLKLPAGTVYAKLGEASNGRLRSFNLQGLCIKDDSLKDDWWYLDPADIEFTDNTDQFEKLEDSLKNGTSLPMVQSVSRDGLFDQDAIFLVFELDDLTNLRDRIVLAIDLELNK